MLVLVNNNMVYVLNLSAAAALILVWSCPELNSIWSAKSIVP